MSPMKTLLKHSSKLSLSFSCTMANSHRKIFTTVTFLFTTTLLTFHQAATADAQATTTAAYNVIKYGAKPDGLTNSTKPFFTAWTAACKSDGPAMIVVPKGRFLLYPIIFNGAQCKNPNMITFYIIGTLVTPLDYNELNGGPAWLDFRYASNVSFIGVGYLDGKGSSYWDCKRAGYDGLSNCPHGPTTLSFLGSKNIAIKGITSLNSQMFHIVINACQKVHIEGVKIRAPEDSPNTDGIHIQTSSEVTISNTAIKTGDDCISIGPGTKNLVIDHVACGPGHGISIGSLAKEADEEGVENVRLKTIVFDHSTNGLRIKSWARASNGFVRDIVFQDVLMRNVANPITIDQNYCPYNRNCPGQESSVKVSNVIYQGIRGTSTTKFAVNFNCSALKPCTGLKLQDVDLTFGNQPAESFCSNAVGVALGLVQPKSCF